LKKEILKEQDRARKALCDYKQKKFTEEKHGKKFH